MRPPRIALLVLFFAATSFVFFRSLTALARASTLSKPLPRPSSRFTSYFTFTTPLTLFPPNAAISLTDDNSTSFPARPAAFGPALPSEGLSGQLWIGSGFADDNLQEGEGEGELGCSDIPGWEDGNANVALKISTKTVVSGDPKDAAAASDPGHPRRRTDAIGALDLDVVADLPSPPSGNVDDGTDDYLQQGLTPVPRSRGSAQSSSTHADIQSLQEMAEINGKVVLLSRGGCGFLEKVKWAQRRGAKALIVGDNRKGGPLIQMFARGDTSNVTIPSVFTARTTAHLLSSLTQPGSFIEDSIDENGRPTLKVQHSDKARKHKKLKQEEPAAGESSRHSGGPYNGGPRMSGGTIKSYPPKERRGWFSRLFRWGFSSGGNDDSSSSARDWVIVEDWNDESDRQLRDSLGGGIDSSSDAPPVSDDAYQVWDESGMGGEASSRGSDGTDNSDAPPSELNSEGDDGQKTTSDQGGSGGIMSKLFGEADKPMPGQPPVSPIPTPEPDREGLWVTITPSSGAGSFFDTLLVLVISPLITLSVVYALLIVRARIRRRRWRAPKSVVEQLPVRTFHRVTASPIHSPRLPSPPSPPISNSPSPTTPLLQSTPPRSRPRSRTTTGVPESSNLLSAPHVSSEWKKYMGRQVECVVCLEEYIDGVSRVMSLPCGHEFHENCITPWLTTRRRTCPICKGDVVKSLAQGLPSSPRYEPYRGSSDDEDLRPPTRTNTGGNRESELEQGLLSLPRFERRGRESRLGAWLGYLTNGFGPSSRADRESEDPRIR